MGSWRGISTWSRISQAAASGSRKTARRVEQILGEQVEVAFGESEEFGEGAGMIHDAEHGARGAVAGEAAAAPLAVGAGEIDFAGDAAADEGASVRFDDFGDEFVAGGAGEAVVAALKLEIGIADAGGEQAKQGEALGPGRHGHLAQGDGTILQMYREHPPIIELHACGTCLF